MLKLLEVLFFLVFTGIKEILRNCHYREVVFLGGNSNELSIKSHTGNKFIHLHIAFKFNHSSSLNCNHWVTHDFAAEKILNCN